MAIPNLAFISLVLTMTTVHGQTVERVDPVKRAVSAHHGVVRYQQGEFTAWPANNGLWTWDGGQEILVGFTYGRYVEQEGHKIAEPRNGLARSTDSGETWSAFFPENYADDRLPITNLTEPMDFEAPDFALRVCGMGYHGNAIDEPCFYYSYDRGATWNGPFRFAGMENMNELEGITHITPRTDYRVLGSNSCQVFASATGGPFEDKTFVMETGDGGLSFSFVSWVVPPTDPYRAVMPQTVAVGDETLVSVMRRRDKPGTRTECWLDAYASSDGGRSWSFLSKVAYTGFGDSNGNPPAMTRLEDGRLIVAYGNRSLRMLMCRLSEDNGKTWGDEIILRDDLRYDGRFADFGYPRVMQRPDGKILVCYYFSDDEHPEQYIASTIFTLDEFEDAEIERSMVLPPEHE